MAPWSVYGDHLSQQLHPRLLPHPRPPPLQSQHWPRPPRRLTGMRHMPVPDFVYGLGVRLGGRPRTSAAAARLAPSPTEPLHPPGVVNSKALPKATSCATTPTGALRARRTGEDRAGAWRLGFFANAEEAALCIARSPEGQAAAAAVAVPLIAPMTRKQALQQAQAERGQR